MRQARIGDSDMLRKVVYVDDGVASFGLVLRQCSVFMCQDRCGHVILRKATCCFQVRATVASRFGSCLKAFLDPLLAYAVAKLAQASSDEFMALVQNGAAAILPRLTSLCS